MLSYTRIEIRARLGAILVWGLGILSYLALVLLLYPSLQEQLARLDLSNIAIYQAFGDLSQMDTFPGYYKGYVLSFLPILVAIYSVINGAATLVGEEEQGTLEMFVTQPLARRHIVLGKAIALAIAPCLILLINFAGLYVCVLYVNTQVNATLTTAQLFQSTLAAWPLTFLFAMFGLWAGAYLPRRSAALGLGLTALLGSWLINNLAQSNTALKDISRFLPFKYYPTSILDNGVNPNDLLIVAGAGLVFLALAILSFQRRNITVGAWPWQRARPAPDA